MAVTRIQGGLSENSGASAVASFSATFGAAVGSGNTVLVFIVTADTSNHISSVTDDKGNTYTLLDNQNDAGNGEQCATYSRSNITNAPTTVTVNYSPNQIPQELFIEEFGGVSSSPLDGHISNFNNFNTTTDNVTSTNITTTVNGDAIVGFVACTGAFPVTLTQGTGYTPLQNGTVAISSKSEWKTQTTAGAVAATFTTNTSQAYTVFVVALKASVVAATPFITQQTVNPTLSLVKSADYQEVFFLGLIGKDAKLTGNQYTVNPILPTPSTYNWQDNFFLGLISKDVTVFGRSAGPNPNLPSFLNTGFNGNFKTNVTNNPFVSSVLFNPQGLPYYDQSSYGFIQLQTVVFPNVITQFPASNSSVNYNQYWIKYTNPFGYPTTNNPFVSNIWFVPSGPSSKVSDWQDNFFLGLAGQDSLPKGDQSYNNPTIVIRNAIDWQDYFYRGLAGQDNTVFGRIAGPNPTLPVLPNRDWQWFNANTAIIIPPNPIFPPLWFVPKGQDPKVQDWIEDLNLELLGQDTLIVGKQRFDVPVVIPRNPQDFQNFFELCLQQNLPPGKTQNLNPNLPVQPQFFILPLSQPLNIPPTFPVVTPSSIPSQFPPLPIQQNLYTIDWVNFIPPPPPPPPGPVGGGRYITEAEVAEANAKFWQYKPTADTVHATIQSIAKTLGKRGGIQSGISRRGR